MPDHIFQCINDALHKLKNEPNFPHARAVINAIVSLLDIDVDDTQWKLFTDSNGKIASNAAWFKLADGYADRRAAYALNIDQKYKLDIKAFWLEEMNKSKMSWCVALTPNFEDFGMDLGDNVGIDFFVSQDCSRVIVVLSNNHVLRTLEVRDELSNTQKDIFALWHQQFDFSNKIVLHDSLWKSFDFESVNKKFFKGVSGFFTELVQHLTDTANVMDARNASIYVNRLVGRMIFVWFLDKKGIINAQQKYFIPDSLNATDYYKKKLSILFFQVLNTEIADRSGTDDKITPYLNGGLFEEKDDDQLIGQKDAIFPADYFDRFLTFLHHYNFTTDESSSDYQQTAIDPEMLGRIFENLLAEHNEETGETARKAKGAFYTPREIVDYMTKQTLIAYLKSQIKVHKDHMEYLERIVTARPHEWRDQQRNYRRDVKSYKQEIIDALDRMTVLDPACGSGAFPMGMMQLLVQTYERLESRFDAKKVKKQVIKNNLFGVDIEPMAVEIARLRAWLSIIVDEDNDSKDIKPLPNLDFKFITANTLLSLAKDEGLFDNRELKEKMQQIREEYFDSGNKRTKEKLRKDFYRLTGKGQMSLHATKRERQLLSYDPFKINKVAEFFDPQFMFSVDCFDAVIGNPPYVQLQKNGGRLANMYEHCGYKTFQRTGDIYALFYERGLTMTCQDTGLLCYITSNKWMRSAYGSSLRGFFAQNNPLLLIDFGGFKVFESATVDTNVLLVQNSANQQLTKAVHFKNDFKKGDDVAQYIEKNVTILSKLSSDTWAVLTPIEQSIKRKIEEKGVPLKDWEGIKINRGILTGYNDAFIIDGAKKDELIAKDPRSAEIIKPILRGKDIKRYHVDFADKWLIAAHNGYTDKKGNKIPPVDIKKYPAVKDWLDLHWDKIKKRQDKGVTPYNLRNCAYQEDFKKEKIIWSDMSTQPTFHFLKEETFFNNTAYMISGENILCIVGVLNSSLIKFYFPKIATDLGKGGSRYFKQFVELVSVPFNIDKLRDKVGKIIAMKNVDKNADISDLEKEIDQMVYEMYGLTSEEIGVIQGE